MRTTPSDPPPRSSMHNASFGFAKTIPGYGNISRTMIAFEYHQPVLEAAVH